MGSPESLKMRMDFMYFLYLFGEVGSVGTPELLKILYFVYDFFNGAGSIDSFAFFMISAVEWEEWEAQNLCKCMDFHDFPDFFSGAWEAFEQPVLLHSSAFLCLSVGETEQNAHEMTHPCAQFANLENHLRTCTFEDKAHTD